jgi:hypothetical protein
LAIPPDTGASMSVIFFRARAAPVSRVINGWLELMSTTMVPGLAAAAIPFSPSATSRTTLPSGSMVTMTSATDISEMPLSFLFPYRGVCCFAKLAPTL